MRERSGWLDFFLDRFENCMIELPDTNGNSLGQLYQPYDIAKDWQSETLYIADYANKRIMSYLLGVSAGTVVVSTLRPGMNSSTIKFPIAINFDSYSNRLIIINNGAHTVFRWTLSTSTWSLVAGNSDGSAFANLTGIRGTNASVLNGAYRAALDSQLHLYVADFSDHRVQKFLGY